MPTRSDLTDTRRWDAAHPPKGSPAATLAPGEPFPDETPPPTYAVTFLDRTGAFGWAHRPAQMDCLPAVFVRLDAQGLEGYMRRTWKLEMSKGGPVYREQAPVPFEPVATPSGDRKGPPKSAGYGDGNKKRPKGRAPAVVVDEEAWDA